MSVNELTFNRRAVRPLECIGAGWRLIKGDYWLFLGISVVGMLLGSVVPMGVLIGPAMCGIYLCLLRRADGQPVSFDMLFQGFNYFLQSLIATLIMLLPALLLVIPGYILLFGSMMAILPAGPQGKPPDPSAIWAFVGLFGVFMLLMFLISIFVGAFFIFTFPLIVDRQLSGVEAVRASIKAALGNLGGVLGLMVLNMLMGLAGMLACYIGAFFLMPIQFAAVAVAYRQVFPADDAPMGGDLAN